MNPLKKLKNKFRKVKHFIDSVEYVKDFKRFMTAATVEDAGYKYVVESDLRKAIKPGVKFGMYTIGFGILFFIIWGGLAPLDSAAIAEGVITLSGKRKTIQHLEGGVIEKIDVIDGQEVKAGMVLIELNSTAAKARLQVIDGQLVYIDAIEARLKAEQEGKEEIVFDPQLFDLSKDEIKKIVETQQTLFDVRKEVRKGHVNVLNERIGQYTEQLKALEIKLKTMESQKLSLEEELENLESLFKKGLALKPRLLEMRRQVDSATSAVAEINSNIFSAKESISEAKLQILNVDNEFQKEVASEFKENHTRLLEMNEQYNAAYDVLQRTKIAAPNDGIVTDLQYHTIGGVIGPGSKILDIIPQDDKLIVEAKVRSQDIDSVHVGLVAKVQLGAFKSRIVPRLDGRVIYVSADATVDQHSGQSYYIARIEIDQRELNSLNLDLKLSPGMPASVFIVKGTRTFLQYLLSPIRDSFFRAFKEA